MGKKKDSPTPALLAYGGWLVMVTGCSIESWLLGASTLAAGIMLMAAIILYEGARTDG